MTLPIERDLPINPHYGGGRYRRRIRLTGSPGEVYAEVEDSHHGMRCRLSHDGTVITGLESDLPRIPLSTCSGAAEPIKRLIGLALDLPLREISRHGDPRRNCTHLFDLALLAIAHAPRGTCVRQYDVVVEDEKEGLADASVFLNGELMHTWQIQHSATIETPAALRGRPMLKGFSAWAEDYFSGDALEAARVLQRGYFVSRARRYDLRSMLGQSPLSEPDMLGSCYSYSAGIVETAVRTANERDFSDSADDLLKFL